MSAPAWPPRWPPLPPAACAAEGAVAGALLRRALAAPKPEAWRGVRGEGVVVLLGEELPWVEGATWLGLDPDMPGLYVPTTCRPPGPADLWAEALLQRVGDPADGPFAVLPGSRATRLVPLGGARPLGAAELRAALDAQAPLPPRGS